jgi:hypothetical protein
MRHAVAVVPLLVAACAIPDEKQPIPPFGCLNQPLPTVASDPVTIAGTVGDPLSGEPAAGATVAGFLVGGSAAVFSVTTNSTGAFDHDQPTGGSPIDGFLQVTLSGFVDSFYYPPAPIAKDLVGEQLQLFTSDDVSNLGSIAMVTIDPSQAQLLVIAEDCTGSGVSGATIMTEPAGTLLYFAAGRPKAGLPGTDATGAALMVNVAPGVTTVGASAGGMTLRSHEVTTVAGAIVQTEVQP